MEDRFDHRKGEGDGRVLLEYFLRQSKGHGGRGEEKRLSLEVKLGIFGSLHMENEIKEELKNTSSFLA